MQVSFRAVQLADGVLYSMISKKKRCIFVHKSQNLVVGSQGSECWCEKCVFLVTGCQESLQRLHSFTGETWTEHWKQGPCVDLCIFTGTG